MGTATRTHLSTRTVACAVNAPPCPTRRILSSLFCNNSLRDVATVRPLNHCSVCVEPCQRIHQDGRMVELQKYLGATHLIPSESRSPQNHETFVDVPRGGVGKGKADDLILGDKRGKLEADGIALHAYACCFHDPSVLQLLVH